MRKFPAVRGTRAPIISRRVESRPGGGRRGAPHCPIWGHHPRGAPLFDCLAVLTTHFTPVDGARLLPQKSSLLAKERGARFHARQISADSGNGLGNTIFTSYKFQHQDITGAPMRHLVGPSLQSPSSISQHRILGCRTWRRPTFGPCAQAKAPFFDCLPCSRNCPGGHELRWTLRKNLARNGQHGDNEKLLYDVVFRPPRQGMAGTLLLSRPLRTVLLPTAH